MTNISKVSAPGGKPLSSTVSVYTDGVSIQGNGTKEDPLVASGGSVGRLVAAAVVNTGSSTFVAEKGFSGLPSKTSPGVWSLTLATPIAIGANVVAEPAIGGGLPGFITWSSIGIGGDASNILIRTFDTTGTPADRDFSVTVNDLTPLA